MNKSKIIIIILLSLLFFLSSYTYIKVDRELKQEVVVKNKLIEIADIPNNVEESNSLINFEDLKKINDEIVAWIKLDGTQINYPIVQGKDNSYYLNHSFEKKYNSLGSIFMDYYSSSNFYNKNTFIYGHNTKNGSMFGQLKKYKDFNFFKEHPFYFIYTPDTTYKILIFSVYIDDAKSDSYKQLFETSDDYNNYIDLITKKSIYKTDIEINKAQDRIITLYTCNSDRGVKTDRLFIHGIITTIL